MKFLISLIVVLLSSHAYAETCGKDVIEGESYGYCIEPATGGNPDVLYYLHGGGGDETHWAKGFGEDFKQVWSKGQTGSPAVITFSFGPSWLLGDVKTPRNQALLPLVHDKLLPLLESKMGGLRGRRFVMGPSMGGFNSAELGLRYPQSFAAVLPLCPGMMTLTLSSTPAEVDAFLKENSPNVRRNSVEGLLNWVRHDFVTQQNWDRHDPLLLASKATSDGPRFYVHSTYDDEYGFYPAAQKFVAILKARGVRTNSSFPGEGGHCTHIDENAVAEMVDVMK
jgi:pimeloyl-ACP methyl ester carboxylesterase